MIQTSEHMMKRGDGGFDLSTLPELVVQHLSGVTSHLRFHRFESNELVIKTVNNLKDIRRYEELIA